MAHGKHSMHNFRRLGLACVTLTTVFQAAVAANNSVIVIGRQAADQQLLAL